MTRPVVLYDLAHCRAGDKGDDAILALIPYRTQDFWILRKLVTKRTVSSHFSGQRRLEVLIVELPMLSAMVITIRGVLYGGVTRATGADPHGKTLSSHLLSLEVNWPTS